MRERGPHPGGPGLDTRHTADKDRRGLVVTQPTREFARRTRLEDVTQPYPGGGTTQQRDDPGRQQRMPTRRKEVGVHAHVRQPQGLREGGAHLFLGRRAGLAVLVSWGEATNRQGRGVHFAARRQGELAERDDRGGHHVGGKLPGDSVADLTGIDAGRGDPGQQAVTHGGAVRPGDSRAHPGNRQQRRDDLIQFDAEAPDLHLVVGTSDEAQLTVSSAADEIACAVQPAATSGGVRDETGRGHSGTSQVAPGQGRPAYVELADTAVRNWAKPLVEDADHLPERGPPDRDRVLVLRSDPAMGDVDRGLRGPVPVEQTQPISGLTGELRVKDLAGHHESQPVGEVLRPDRHHGGRGEDRMAGPRQELEEVTVEGAGPLGHHEHGRPREQALGHLAD